MNKTFKTILAAGAFVAGVQQAQAVGVGPFRDARNGAGLLAPTDVATDTFNIVTAGAGITITQSEYPDFLSVYSDIGGFSPLGLGGTDTATSANAVFYFRDALNDEVTEVVNISLDLTSVVASGVVFNGGFAILGGAANDIAILASLTADGLLDYTVTVTGESSVILDYAVLRVLGDRQSTSTPDGGATAALLGLGMIGVAAVRRKLS